jgi:hypothetical protein
MRVDFSQIRLIPIASVLAHYRVEVRKRNSTELVANCPFPSHAKSEHQKMTLAISIEKNRWYDHSETCRVAGNHPKGGDVIDLVCRIENLLPLDAAKKLAELFAVGNGHITPPSKPEAPVCNVGLAFRLDNLDPDHDFIRSRGISLETAMEFGIGFFGRRGYFKDCICFPVFEKGVLTGYLGRTVLEVSESNPKWKLPKGLQRTFIYGIEKCNPSAPLLLVESAWGVLHFFQHQRQAAALVGTSMTPQQELLLEPFKDITVAFDNDIPGRTAAAKVCEQLKARGHNVTKAFLKE